MAVMWLTENKFYFDNSGKLILRCLLQGIGTKFMWIVLIFSILYRVAPLVQFSQIFFAI